VIWAGAESGVRKLIRPIRCLPMPRQGLLALLWLRGGLRGAERQLGGGASGLDPRYRHQEMG